MHVTTVPTRVSKGLFPQPRGSINQRRKRKTVRDVYRTHRGAEAARRCRQALHKDMIFRPGTDIHNIGKIPNMLTPCSHKLAAKAAQLPNSRGKHRKKLSSGRDQS